MFRGLLTGGVAGVAVSAVALVAVTLVTEPPAGTRPPMAPVVEPPEMAPGSGAIVGDMPGALPGGAQDAGGAPAPSVAPEVAGPAPEPDLALTDTATPTAPEAGQDTSALTLPQSNPDTPVVAGPDAPVLTVPQSRAPEPPVAEADLALATEPLPVPPSDTPPQAPVLAPGQASDLADPGGVVAAPAPTAASDLPETAPAAPEPAAVPDAPRIADTAPAERPEAEVDSLSDQVLAALSETAPVLPEVIAPEPSQNAAVPDLAAPSIDELLPSTGTAPAALPEVVQIVPDPSEPAEVPAASDPAADPATEAARNETADAGTAPSAGPRIALGGEAASLPGSTAGVRITRPGTALEEPAEAAEAAAEPLLPDDAPALLRHAASFENTAGQPLMSIVLIDDGGLGAGAIPALQSVAFPVTVALDAGTPDAAARMRAYRAAGFEVMAMVNLPEGALPSDADVALEATFAALPEAIGLLDAGAGGLQADRAVTEQAMARLATDGRGFLTASQGLNTALRSAEAASVPAAVIYRDLDAEDQDARVIRRFLDQAAFRARQQGGVVLVGRVRADTVSALTLWGTANRAGQVTIAPLSATLGQ